MPVKNLSLGSVALIGLAIGVLFGVILVLMGEA